LNREESKSPFSGAGGNWQVIDEITSSKVIQQKDSLSCGVACGEMLLREYGINNINQEIIAQISGIPVNIPNLAQILNRLDYTNQRQWIGGYLDFLGTEIELLNLLMSTGTWIAELREMGMRLGHLVVIDGYDSQGKIKIRDPWEGTEYKIEKEDFLKYWTLQAIYTKKL
jgi:filamentous hemagglutinin